MEVNIFSSLLPSQPPRLRTSIHGGPYTDRGGGRSKLNAISSSLTSGDENMTSSKVPNRRMGPFNDSGRLGAPYWIVCFSSNMLWRKLLFPPLFAPAKIFIFRSERGGLCRMDLNPCTDHSLNMGFVSYIATTSRNHRRRGGFVLVNFYDAIRERLLVQAVVCPSFSGPHGRRARR